MSIETKTQKQYKTVKGYRINLASGVTELTTNQVTAFNASLDVIKSLGVDIDFDTFVNQNLSKLLGSDFNGKFIISEGKGVSANTPIMNQINAKIEELKRIKFEQEKLLKQCLAKCRKEDNKNEVGDEVVAGAKLEDIGIAEAKNISCEKIESGTQVVVSGTIIEPSGCGEDDLYVMVEACGCCEDDD